MSDPFKQCPYLLLGLPETATMNEILKKWRMLVFQTHPDKNISNQATEKTKILNDAKDRAIKDCQTREECRKRKDENDRLRKDEDEKRKRKGEEDRRRREKEDRLCKEEFERMRRKIEEDERVRTSKVERMRRQLEEMERVRKEEAEIMRCKREEEERTRKEEAERMKCKREEEERIQEAKDRMAKEELQREITSSIPIYDIMSEFMLYKSKIPYRHSIVLTIHDRLKIAAAILGDTRPQELMDEVMYRMAEGIKQQRTDAANTKTTATLLEAELRAQCEIERKSKDDAIRRYSLQAEAELKAERQSNDIMKQQLIERTAQLEVERQSNDISRKQLADMMAQLDEERKLKDDAKQQLEAMRIQLETECQSTQNATRQMAEMTIQLDTARKSKSQSNVSGKQPKTDSQDKELPSSDVPSGTKKRKASIEFDANTNMQTLQADLKSFVDSRITASPGRFLTTHAIYDAFIAEFEPKILAEFLSECNFQKTIKKLILDTFQDISYSRIRCEGGERPRGYTGLDLKV